MKKLLIPAAAAVLALCPVTAQAVLITHSGGSTLFNEDYESQTLNATLDTANINPGGNSEEWITDATASPGVGEAVNTNPPSAFQGSQFAHLSRPGGTSEVHADFATDITDGTLTVEFAGYVPSSVPGNAVPIQVRFDEDDEGVPGSDDDIAFQLRWNTNDNKLYWRPSTGGNVDTGVSFVDDTWQIYKLEYNFTGTDSVIVTVDGNSSAPLDTIIEDPTLAFINMRIAQTTGEFFFDAVPEPATGVLLGFGMIAALWGLRRGGR